MEWLVGFETIFAAETKHTENCNRVAERRARERVESNKDIDDIFCEELCTQTLTQSQSKLDFMLFLIEKWYRVHPARFTTERVIVLWCFRIKLFIFFIRGGA